MSALNLQTSLKGIELGTPNGQRLLVKILAQISQKHHTLAREGRLELYLEGNAVGFAAIEKTCNDLGDAAEDIKHYFQQCEELDDADSEGGWDRADRAAETLRQTLNRIEKHLADVRLTKSEPGPLDIASLPCQEVLGEHPTIEGALQRCGKPSAGLVYHQKDRTVYPMCPACHSHNTKNRGGCDLTLHHAMERLQLDAVLVNVSDDGLREFARTVLTILERESWDSESLADIEKAAYDNDLAMSDDDGYRSGRSFRRIES